MNRKTRRRAAKVGQRAGGAAPLSRRLAVHLQRARAELDAGRPADAEASCRLALRQRPDHPDALDLLGAALMDLGRYDSALDCFRRAAAPGHAMAEYHMGRALKLLDRFEDAVASYRRALVLRPGLAQAHYHLGEALLAQNRADEAAAAYRAALACQPNNPRAYNRLGITLATQNRFDEAATLIRRALALDPRYAEAYSSLGRMLIAQRKWDEAVPVFRRAVELNPSLVEAYRQLGVALRRLGRLDEAIDAHRQELALGADGPEAQLWLSALLAAVGRPDEGRAMLEAGVRRRPWTTIRCRGRDKPLAVILRLLGVQNSNLIVGEGGIIEIHPSHFEARNLIARERFLVHEYLVLDDNLAGGGAGPPDFDIVVNSIGDPDVESASLESAQRFIARQSLPHINTPERVLPTSRDRVYEMLRDIDGTVVPKVRRFDSLPTDGPSFLAALERHELTPPVLVRPIGSHSGDGLIRIDRAADWDRAGTGRPSGPAYVTAFHDFRGGDGYYRKLRFFCVGGKIFPQHLLMSDRWNVHIGARDAMMKDRPWMQDEEHRFLDDHVKYVGTDVCRALDEIAARIGLDFFGIDGALLADGRMLIFEANACMRVPPIRPRPDAYKNEYTRRVIDAFERMILDKVRDAHGAGALTAPAVS